MLVSATKSRGYGSTRKAQDAHAQLPSWVQCFSHLPRFIPTQNRASASVAFCSYLRFVVLPWWEGLAGPFYNTVNMEQLCFIIKDFTKELHSADLPLRNFSLF